MRLRIVNGHSISADGVFPAAVTQFQKAFQEGVPHFGIRETDAHIHGEGIQGGEFSQSETGEPPVKLFPFKQDTSVPAKHKAHGKTFRILCAVVERSGEALGTDIVLIGVVDADLRSSGDSVLALPEFDHPAFSGVGKTDGFAVHHHVEQGGAFVVELTVSHFPLPAVHEGIENVFLSVIRKARFRKIPVQSRLLGRLIHGGAETARAYLQNDKSREKCDDKDSGDTE